MIVYYTAAPCGTEEFLLRVLALCGAEGPVLHTPAGKPYLANGPHFSVTDTAGFIAVAVGNCEAGLDAERRRPRPLAALKRRLTPEEQREDFFRLWTAKEAYIKFRGLTLARALPSLEYQKGALWMHGAPLGVFLQHFERKGCCLCLCTEREEPVLFTAL